MSTWKMPCAFCSYPVKSSDDMVVLREDEGNGCRIIISAAHRECYQRERDLDHEKEMLWGKK